MQEPDLVQDDSTAPTEVKTHKPRIVIPMWVALAAMALAVVLAGIIISLIAKPLLNLVSPEKPDIPVPSGAHLDEKDEDPNYADTQWLYSSKQTGCEVALFFDKEDDVECTYSPYACAADATTTATPGIEPTPTAEGTIGASFSRVATCTKRVKQVASSYTWRVEIFDGYSGEYQTKFRIYLFSER
ncbi:MAG: hypothetical protein HY862_05970 [Chloroflexi bacterium]|nr:hypothetical protein [Chloroflexota bacterium]